VALTKVDLVEPARRGEVREEIAILLDGTGLEGAPIVEVSTVTGEGLDLLRATLRDALRSATRIESAGGFRLPVDRAFVMRGHGVVVTGTATAGVIRPGAVVRVLPGASEGRVRSVQVHGQAVDLARSGQRVALNLGGVEHGTVRRGQIVCDPELDRTTARFDAWVELRPAVRRPLATHALVRVYLGTAEAMGKIVWLDGRDTLGPKESAYAQLVLRDPIAAFGGDRFILRAQNASATIGGGVVLHPFASRPTQRIDPRLPQLAALRDATTPRARLDALLALERGFAVSPDVLAAAANLRAATVRELLADHATVHPLPDAAHAEAYTSAAKWAELRAAVGDVLGAFHSAQPRQPGMEMESLRTQVAPDLSAKLFRAVVEQLAHQGVLLREDSLVRLPTHVTGLQGAEMQLANRLVTSLTAGGFTPPDAKQLAAELGISAARLAVLVAELERTGRIVRAAPDMFFSPDAVERAQGLIRGHVATHGEITAAAFRDLIAASRKFSIALLNYFDRTGFTLRVGDIRKLRR
jgi:selenocysteine-specific elongation factor